MTTATNGLLPLQVDNMDDDHDDDDNRLAQQQQQPSPPSSSPPRDINLARLLASCSSIGGSSETTTTPCPLCLDDMTTMDHQHALLCPTRHCHYNFCTSCIESLISSSKDDYEMASDGNAHVKVFLHCPNCRADLSATIRDTLLLRKVDTVTWLLSTSSTTTTTTTTGGLPSSVTLTPSQERTLAAMQELDVQETIQKARDVEEAFWRRHSSKKYDGSRTAAAAAVSGGRRPSLARWEASIRELASSPSTSSSNIELTTSIFEERQNDNDEWGVEADLIYGVHNSIHLPRGSASSITTSTGVDPTAAVAPRDGPKKKKKSSNGIDPTVFNGLEFTMTHAEKLQVTQWMTSGNVNDLASAARLFQELELYARQGLSPAKRQARSRQGSVYQIVAETRKVHEQIEEKKDNQGDDAAARGPRPQKYAGVRGAAGPAQAARRNQGQQQLQQQQILAERRQLEKAIREQTSLLERFPLPVRMPKCVQLDLPSQPQEGGGIVSVLMTRRHRAFPLAFCNDTWDGTVLDAYSKLTITGGGQPPNSCIVTKKEIPPHAGVYHVLSLGQYAHHYGPDVEMTFDHSPQRVLVASVHGEAGRQGIIKGDVVTHVDGEEFHGTVDDLLELLHSKAATTTTTAEAASQQQPSKVVEFIFNAEPSVAEALRRRAVVME